ncbi:pectinesterase family protein [Paenibacillus ottowii]|uniref:pectinesterase family protein n=1 Tax=Paenibacillus ottowii TaxID=2315729 RepID=UPI002731DED0|nr:pectinesterase family protein [Paenibacillus ottowii]MDP1511823.1 pectinesterase family protein [Paenibacillus ottowii]
MSKQRTWKKVLCNMVVGSMLLTLCPPLIQAETAAGTEMAKVEKVEKIATNIPAFPGAEGGGKYVTGGRGGEVYEVTTLADYGKGEQMIPGSLRAAVSSDNRTVVFRVGGTIHLKEPLKILGNNLTVAGQTAPGDGITVSDYTTGIDADNVIFRYLRFRLTDRYPSEDDALGARYHKNIMIDHCSFSWSVDEVLSLYDNVNTTVQWSIASESMLMTTHQKGRHGYGGIWGGRNSTYHHNLLAHNASRNPRFPTDKKQIDAVEMTNNVIYNWGFFSSYGGGEGSYNVLNNYYKYGPNTYKDVRGQIFVDVGSKKYKTRMFIGGNYMYGNDSVTQDNWQLGTSIGSIIDPSTRLAEPIEVRGEYDNGISPDAYGPYQATDAQTAYAEVLAGSGATLPRRDAVDARIMNDVKNGMGAFINSPREAGWIYDDYSVTTAELTDSDRDGMPDEWERAHGLDPKNADDRNGQEFAGTGEYAHFAKGYTNLEVYLNDLIAKLSNGSEVDNPEAAVQVSDEGGRSLKHNDILEAGRNATITATAKDQDGIAHVEFIIDGKLAGKVENAPYQIDWNRVMDGTHYIVARVTDRKGTAAFSNSVTIHVNTTASSGSWLSEEVGSEGNDGYIQGHTQVLKEDANGSSIRLKSAGDIDGQADLFHYAYQKWEGDGEITARVEKITPVDDNAEAGVMIRESLKPGSKMAFMSLAFVKYGKQGILISRDQTDGKTKRASMETFITTPYSVRLVRQGQKLTGWVSADGVTNWEKVGETVIDFPDHQPLLFGLATDASKQQNDVWNYNTSEFSNVTVHKLTGSGGNSPTSVVVSTYGPADYTSLQAAIDAVPDNSNTKTVIHLKNGTYREKIKVNSSKKNLSIIGEDRDKTIIAFDDTAKTVVDGKELGTSNSYTMRVQSPDFVLENVTVANTEGTGQVQAVALYAEGDRGKYHNVKITGLQDTLLVNRGRQYFKDSYISGSVDFIFGNAPAVFDNSIIHSLRAGYVTAASTEENQPGFVFTQCRLTSEAGLTGKVDLGRPWRPYAHVTFLKTYMDDHIKPGGWNNWGKESNEQTARFGEFDNFGPGAESSGRVPWAKQLAADEANQYTVEAVLSGTDHWDWRL